MFPTRGPLTLLLAVAALATDAPSPLRVIRVTPADDATPSSVITVTFDRPVAGSLDRSVDPRSVLTLEPALAGTWDWRDPVTVRFLPARPLTAGLILQVTVRPGFSAMDGSTLSAPYQWNFRVRGPRLLAGLPAGPGQTARFLPPDARFQLVLSAPADSALLARLVYLELNRACPAAGIIPLRPGQQTALPEDAPWQFKEAGGWEREHAAEGALARAGVVRWSVDGRQFHGARLPLEAGRHRIRAELGQSWDEVSIEVKGR